LHDNHLLLGKDNTTVLLVEHQSWAHAEHHHPAEWKEVGEMKVSLGREVVVIHTGSTAALAVDHGKKLRAVLHS